MFFFYLPIQLLLFADRYEKSITVRNPNSFINRKRHEKSSKIKRNFDYLGVFIEILLVLSKNPCSLAAKLC